MSAITHATQRRYQSALGMCQPTLNVWKGVLQTRLDALSFLPCQPYRISFCWHFSLLPKLTREPGTSLPVGARIHDPITADLEQVLRTPIATWRSPQLEVFRWNLFPDVLVVDTRDFHLQDRMFTRLAYFVEKKGFRGALMTNLQLSGRHGWNAHDYGPDGLASFYMPLTQRCSR